MATARKASGKVVAVTSFVSITDDGYRVVQAGEELEASDELVKANPGHFEPKKART
jgi:hypothetical protein